MADINDPGAFSVGSAAALEPDAPSAGDVNTESGFSAALTQQADGSHAETEVRERHGARDISQDSPEDIVRGVLAPDLTTDISSGLRVAGQEIPQTPDQLREASRRQYDEIRESDSGWADYEARRDEERWGVEKARVQEPLMVFREAWSYGTDEEATEAALKLKATAPGLYAMELQRIEDEGYAGLSPSEQLDLADEDDPFGAVGLDRAATEAGNQAMREAAQGQAVRDAQERGQSNAKRVVELIHDYVSEHGEAANPRIAQASEALYRNAGVDLMQVFAQDPEQGAALLRATDASLEESFYAQRERAIQQAILDASDTIVSSGLEQLTPWGWQRMNAVQLGPADTDRAVEKGLARAHRPRRTVGQMRRDILSPEATSVAHGLTGANGKPISVDTATGAHARAAEEKRRAYQETFGPPGW